jgi:hypothetical protein
LLQSAEPRLGLALLFDGTCPYADENTNVFYRHPRSRVALAGARRAPPFPLTAPALTGIARCYPFARVEDLDQITNFKANVFPVSAMLSDGKLKIVDKFCAAAWLSPLDAYVTGR